MHPPARRCIPVRYKGSPGRADSAEVLLITSRGGKGWLFPKVSAEPELGSASKASAPLWGFERGRTWQPGPGKQLGSRHGGHPPGAYARRRRAQRRHALQLTLARPTHA